VDPRQDPIHRRLEDTDRIGDEALHEVRTTGPDRETIVPKGRPLTVHSQAQPRGVAVEDHAVDGSSVPLLDDLDLGEKRLGIEGRVAGVYAIADERLRDAGRRARLGEPDPEIPVLAEPISSIESVRWQGGPADDHA
jgi:hypothetical protein